jgi:hypothetical protein
MARRKELYEVQFPETKAGGDRKSAKAKSNGQNVRKVDAFAKATATGKTERTVRRAVARSAALGAETLTRIKGTSLAKGVEQDALAKLTPEQREPIIARAEAGDAPLRPRQPGYPASRSSA